MLSNSHKHAYACDQPHLHATGAATASHLETVVMAIASPPLRASAIVDEVIVQALVTATEECMTMCNTRVRCVAVASVPCHDFGSVTGMIGLHGAVSGFVTINMSEAAACHSVGGLLQDRFGQLTAQVIDGVGEMTNLVAGGVKRALMGTRWAFQHVTVPSVIVGQRYQIAYARGIEYGLATFELENAEALLLTDRLLHVAVSLIKL